MSSEKIINVKNLVKEFGKKKALNSVNLSLQKGEFLTIFGPNGAGKTTLIKSIANLINASKGEIEIEGKILSENPEEIRQHIGLISHNPFLYDDLSANENLTFYGQMYFVQDLENKINFLLKKVGLAHRKYDLVRTFSRGMLQKLSIARALIHDPLILLLDEPYTGLDPLASEMFDELLIALKNEGNHSFIMTSHDMNKGLNLSDRVCILSEGKIVFETEKDKINLESFKQIYREKVKA